jgi:hypothetical protein
MNLFITARPPSCLPILYPRFADVLKRADHRVHIGWCQCIFRDPSIAPRECKPGAHLPPSITNRLRAFEHARVRYQTQKAEHAGPGQTDGNRSIQLSIKPVAREFMLSE